MSFIFRNSLLFISVISFHSTLFADGSYLFCSNEKSEWYWAANPDISNADSSNQYFWLEGNLNIINAPISLHAGLKLNTNDLLSRRDKRSTHSENDSIQSSYNSAIPILNIDLEAFANSNEWSELNEWEKLENWHSWETYSQDNLSRTKRASISQHNDQTSILKSQISSEKGKRACSILVNYCTKTFGEPFRYVGAAGNALAASYWGYIVADNVICPNWDYPYGLITDSQLTVGSLITELTVDLITSGPIKGSAKAGKVPTSLNSRPDSLALSNSNGVSRNVVSVEKAISNLSTPSSERAMSPIDPFGNRMNEITRSASELNIQSNSHHAEAARRPSQIAENLVSSNTQTSEGMGQRKFSYADIAKTPSTEGVNEATNPFQRAGSLRIEMYKIGGINSKPKVPSRAYSLSDLIDFNTAKRFSNFEGRIKDLSPDSQLYEIDIPLVEEHVRVRDAKRVIVERKTGRRWYSPDHYETFIDMQAPIDPVKLAEKNKPIIQSKL
ncbi:ribonuclease domain-containing protein [Fluviispira vulneris]|uniref:ribonuclease domain-containing protein n=1 Tax=Fluviispira vulneris TaxID=2763012 RepID=UPI0016494FE0|nr:ribonuclease domain-containing protein [Fluviispira vulneris]